MRARVIGLGQAAAGDDGVGLAVIAALRGQALARDAELVPITEPSELLPLLETETPIILVDAIVGSPAGHVVQLSCEELAAHRSAALSTHGASVRQVLDLARVLRGERPLPAIHVIAVRITRPDRHRSGLSRSVAAAVPKAARRVLALLQDLRHP